MDLYSARDELSREFFKTKKRELLGELTETETETQTDTPTQRSRTWTERSLGIASKQNIERSPQRRQNIESSRREKLDQAEHRSSVGIHDLTWSHLFSLLPETSFLRTLLHGEAGPWQEDK